MLAIKIEGAAETAAWIRDLPEKVARQTILDLAIIGFREMRAGADRHRKTGRLSGSTYNRELAPLARQVGHATESAPYASFVIHGSEPHVIRPRKAKALRWLNASGQAVFARFVNHPGYKGDNYLDPAAETALRGMDAIVSRALKG